MHAIHSSIGRDIHLRVANEFRDHRLAASTRVPTTGRWILSPNQDQSELHARSAQRISLSQDLPAMGKIPQRRYLLLRNSGRKSSHASEKNTRDFTNCFILLFILRFGISGKYIALIPSFIILREYFYIYSNLNFS